MRFLNMQHKAPRLSDEAINYLENTVETKILEKHLHYLQLSIRHDGYNQETANKIMEIKGYLTR